MCGIVGVLRFGNLGNKDDRNSALLLGNTLLELTEPRGKDATGIAALFDNGNFFGQKMPVRASEFVARFGGTDGDFDGLQTVLREYDEASLRTILGHCRKSSVGGKWNNVNNHPVKAGNIIGIHNGTLKNQDIIFEKLKCERDGTVDSEAIMRLLQHYTKNCSEPFTLEMLEEVTRRLEGSFSVLAFNANNPNQVVSFRDTRPAEYMLIKPLKMVLIGSEVGMLKATLWPYNKLAWNQGIPGFKKLRSSDVEMATLKDEEIALFDLTREITDTTEIKDLYDTRAMPKVAKRIWKKPVTTTYNNNTNTNAGYQNRTTTYQNRTAAKTQTGNANTKNDDKEDKKGTNGTQPDKTTKTCTQGVKKSSTRPVGLAWSNTFEQYVKAFGKKEGSEGHIVVETEKKRVMSLVEAIDSNKKDHTDEVIHDTVDKDVVELDPNDITEVTDDELVILDDIIDAALEPEDDDSLNLSTESVERFNTNETVDINMEKPADSGEVETVQRRESVTSKSVALAAMKSGTRKATDAARDDLDAVKAAVEAAKSIEKYENEDEVAALCNTDLESLKQLPIDKLANRILKDQFAKIFMEGWLAKCEAVKNDKDTGRMAKAKKHIRVLKGVTDLMNGIMHEEIASDRSAEWFKLWAESRVTGEVTAEALKSIYNSGDLRNNTTIRAMVSAMDNAEK